MPGIDQAAVEEELQRTLDCLRDVVKMSRVSLRDVETRSGLAHGTLSRLFREKGLLHHVHILRILHAVDFDAGRFFQIVYGDRSSPKRDVFSELVEEIEGVPPERSRRLRITELTHGDLEAVVLDIMRRATKDQAESRSEPPIGLERGPQSKPQGRQGKRRTPKNETV